MPTTLDLPDELSFDEAQKFSAPAATPPPQPQSLPDEMSFDEFTKLAKPKPAAPSLPDEMSFEDYSKIAKPPQAAPAPVEKWHGFGGAYPNPGVGDKASDMQVGTYPERAEALPSAKSQLKKGRWYNIIDASGLQWAGIWHPETNSFYSYEDVKRGTEAPKQAGVSWGQAVEHASRAGYPTIGESDIGQAHMQQAGTGATQTKGGGLDALEEQWGSGIYSPEIKTRIANALTQGGESERWLTENVPGYEADPHVRAVVQGGMAGASRVGQGLSTLASKMYSALGAPEAAADWQKQAEDWSSRAHAVGEAGKVAQEEIPSDIPKWIQQQESGLISTGTQLAAGGGFTPFFMAQSGAAAYSEATKQVEGKDWTPEKKQAYAAGHAAVDLMTNLLFGTLGAPIKALGSDLAVELKQGVGKAVEGMAKSAVGGITAQTAGSIAAGAIDRVSGMDPEALTPQRLVDELKQALVTQLTFVGVIHAMHVAAKAPEALQENAKAVIESPTWENIYKATRLRLGDPKARETVQEAAKAVLQENAPQGQPEAVPTEQPKPPEVQPTEVPNAPQQVDVVRPDSEGVARQREAVPADQGQVRQGQGAEAGGSDSVPGKGQEVIQPVPPETKVKPGGFGRLLKELPRDDVHQLLTDSGAELTNDDRLIWRDKRDFGQKIGGSRKAVVEWLLGRVKGDDPATYAPNDPEWMGLLKRAREIITGVKAPAATVVEGGGQAQVAPQIQQAIEAEKHQTTPVTQRTVDILNRAYDTNLKLSEPTTPHDLEIRQFLRDRGVDPVYVEGEKFTGLLHGNRVILAAGQEPNAAWNTAIHELAHFTGFDKGSPYQERLINEAAERYLSKALPKYAEKIRANPEQLRQEGIAMLAGEIWSNPSAREQLEAKSPGLLQKVKDFLLKIVGAYTPEDKAARATVDWLRKTVKEAPSAAPEGALLAPLTETTAAKNAAVDEDRAILDRMEVPKGERQTWEQARAEAIANKVPENAMSIAAEVAKSGRQLTATETAGLNERRNELKNEHDFLSERIGKLTDMGDIKSAAADLARIESEFDIVDAGLKKGGTPIGQALAIRKMTIDRDFNILSVKARAKAAKGEALSSKEDLELTGATQRLKKVVDQQEEAQQKLKNIQEDKKTAATKDVQKQVEDLQKKVDEAPLPADLNKLAQKLAKHFVEQGIDGREPLIDAVHNELKQALPDISRRQVMDAISGYGDFKQLSTDEVSVKLRDLKGQMQQLAKLEDMAKGIAPSKTGIERRTPSDTERGLIKQVGEAKKKGGYEVTDPEKQLKTALDAIKTRLKNQITDLTSQIESRTKIVKEKTATLRDEEANRLTAERDRLKEQFDSIFGKPELTDEQRIQMAKRAVEKNIKDYERRLKEGDFSPRNAPSKTPNTPELEALRAQREQLAAKYKEANPNPPELQRAKDKLAQLQEHLAQGTLPEPAVRGKPNPKTEKIQAQIDDLRQQLRDSEPAQKQRLEKTIARLEARLKEFTWWNQPQPKAEKVLSKALMDLDYKAAQLRNEIRQKINALKPHSIFGKLTEPFNAARSIQTSYDISAVGRQGGFIGFGNPLRVAKALGPSLKAMFSGAYSHKVNQDILNRPNAPLYARAGLYLSDPEGQISAQEETYMGHLAQNIPLVGHGIKGSERAYTTYLNLLRADTFDAMSATLAKGGEATLAESKAIANYINVATGRGNFGSLEQAMTNLGSIFYAPRYVASRFQLLAGEPMYHGTARTRKLVAGEYAKFAIGVGTTLALASLAGAKVELDPRSADFMKIRIGNARIDILAGLSQATVFLTRMIFGQTKKESGQVVPIRGEGVPFGGMTANDLAAQFVRSKLSPLPGTIMDIATGKNVVGQVTTLKSKLVDLLTPLSVQDIANAIQQEGVPKGAALGLAAIIGFGLQVYGKTPEQIQKELDKQEKQRLNDRKTMQQNLDLSKPKSRAKLENAQKRLTAPAH